MRVYLAGPELFLADADGIAAAKRGICAAHGLTGVFPTDPPPVTPPCVEVPPGQPTPPLLPGQVVCNEVLPVSEVPSGTAKAVGPTGCVTTNFNVQVYGRQIKKVVFYLDGKKKEAMAAVPDELADATCLVGSPERIRDRFEAWKESPATVMLLGGRDRKTLEMMLELGA